MRSRRVSPGAAASVGRIGEGREENALMNVNTAAGTAAIREGAAEAIVAAPNPWGAGAKLDTAALLDWMLELEQRLRIARLRVVIEGEDVIPEVYETLAGLAAAVHEKLG